MAPWAPECSGVPAWREEYVGAPPGPGGRALTGLSAPPVPQHKAPYRTRVTALLSARARGTSVRRPREPGRALQLDRRVEDDDGVAADPHAVARLAQEPARAAHRDALVDGEALGAGARVRVGHERTGGRAGRGVLEDRRAVEEERAGRRALALDRDEIRARAAMLLEQRAERRTVGRDPIERIGLAHRDDQVRQAGRDDLRRKLGLGVVLTQPERAQRERRLDLGPERNRLLQHRRARDAVAELDVDRLQSGA